MASWAPWCGGASAGRGGEGVVIRHALAPPWLAARRAWRRLAPAPTPGFRIVLLHHVAPHRLAELDAFVHALVRHHGVLIPAQAEAWIGGAPPPDAGPAPCLLSFDDGFASNHAVATRVLEAHGVKALFFVCPGLVELGADQALSRLGASASADHGRRLMTWDAIEALRAMGHTIGAHSMNHHRLSRLQGAELDQEIAASGEVLRRRLGAPVDWFAYPFGDIDSISTPALACVAEHFRYCRSGVRGANHAETRRLALRADQVDLEAPAVYRSLVLDGGLDFRYAGARRRLDAMGPRD